jgi:hypothetical protein
MTRVININRRDFLKGAATLVGGAAISSIPLINSGCKGGPGSTRDLVKVDITYFNHTQGELGQKTYEGLSGEYLNIKVGSLGYSGVDRNRIAVRKATGNRETMGEFLRFSNTGETFPKFPENDENWEAYLMNSSSGAPYEVIDAMGIGWGMLSASRIGNWYRNDKDRTGPEDPILEAVRQLDEALDYPWKEYGRFTKTENSGFGIGYAHTPFYSRSDVWIDPEICITPEDRLKNFINFIFRQVTNSSWLNNQEPHHIICDQNTGNLNNRGRDLMNYVYVRDGNY